MSESLPPDSPSPQEPAPAGMPSANPGKEHHQHKSGVGGWIVGAALVVAGIFLLLNNVMGFQLKNWWALFILIPAISSFGTAWEAWRTAGLHRKAVSSFIGGLVLTFIAAVFLFNLNFGVYWPVFIILGGFALLIPALLPGGKSD